MIHPWEKSRPISAWLPGGLSGQKETKVSRNFKPILDASRCTKCSFCWIFCPDGCIQRGQEYSVNYNNCRGCGVCATECPQKAIEMVREV